MPLCSVPWLSRRGRKAALKRDRNAIALRNLPVPAAPPAPPYQCPGCQHYNHPTLSVCVKCETSLVPVRTGILNRADNLLQKTNTAYQAAKLSGTTSEDTISRRKGLPRLKDGILDVMNRETSYQELIVLNRGWSPFLRLPAKIRNMIYCQYFDSRKNFRPTLLYVCRQIYHEAVLFRMHKTIVYEFGKSEYRSTRDPYVGPEREYITRVVFIADAQEPLDRSTFDRCAHLYSHLELPNVKRVLIDFPKHATQWVKDGDELVEKAQSLWPDATITRISTFIPSPPLSQQGHTFQQSCSRVEHHYEAPVRVPSHYRPSSSFWEPSQYSSTPSYSCSPSARHSEIDALRGSTSPTLGLWYPPAFSNMDYKTHRSRSNAYHSNNTYTDYEESVLPYY